MNEQLLDIKVRSLIFAIDTLTKPASVSAVLAAAKEYEAYLSEGITSVPQPQPSDLLAEAEAVAVKYPAVRHLVDALHAQYGKQH